MALAGITSSDSFSRPRKTPGAEAEQLERKDVATLGEELFKIYLQSTAIVQRIQELLAAARSLR